jgi:hypothetical protein
MDKYKICPTCDYFSNLEQKENYCLKCGAQLIEKCKQCGKEITNPYARNCPNCGAAYRSQLHEKNKGSEVKQKGENL